MVPSVALVAFACTLAALAFAGAAFGQQQAQIADVAESRRALTEARAQAAAAAARGSRLEAAASRVNAAVDRTVAESAAVAARIQETEAQIAAGEAQLRLIAAQQEEVRATLAERQRPLVRLTAALQLLARRPLALAVLRPGSVTDAMHLRALLATMLPQVARRTAALRGELARYRALQQQADRTQQVLSDEHGRLADRRQALAAIETRQRLAARDASGTADREAERALALAEQARDLGALAARLDEAASRRDALARLPGPVLRPARPEDSQVIANAAPASEAAGLGAYQLPLLGRLVSGFGDAGPGQPRSRGIAIAARPGAIAVAPAAGRVAFAGPYRGYGMIVILEHADGWTSLVTGLSQLQVRVGDSLVAGSPLGSVGPGRPVVTLELRRQGIPVNPLDAVAS
ncbi:MAG: peptidoglycan DD-metalloendopeptidase family protein [Novosphingobium sp.]|nr:peptidoglycan DD-metalloendopeptidase family protein [Novosphingobium sp.]